MADEQAKDTSGLTRRDFIKWIGIGGAAVGVAGGLAYKYLAVAQTGDNPLAGAVDRAWEKIYRDQYTYDRVFDWVCSPNDTHACRVRA